MAESLQNPPLKYWAGRAFDWETLSGVFPNQDFEFSDLSFESEGPGPSNKYWVPYRFFKDRVVPGG